MSKLFCSVCGANTWNGCNCKKLPPITRVRMPLRDDGRQVPNDLRWACGYGHIHPSWRHAVACRRRRNKPTGRYPGNEKES